MSIPVSRLLALLVAPALFLSSAAFAISAEPRWSEPESLVGSRIRITMTHDSARAKRIDGRVIRLDDGQIVLASSNGSLSQIVPLASVRRLEVHHGSKRATKRGFWSGAAVGGLAGVVVGGAVGSYVTLDTSANPTRSTIAGGAVGGALGGLIGGTIGAGIGALFEQDDWREEPRTGRGTTLSLEPTRGGVRAALRVSF